MCLILSVLSCFHDGAVSDSYPTCCVQALFGFLMVLETSHGPPRSRPSHSPTLAKWRSPSYLHHARPQRRVPTSRMPSSIFLKMLRGSFAPSRYRTSNDHHSNPEPGTPTLTCCSHIADLVRSARSESSRFPMTIDAPRSNSANPARGHPS